MFSIAQIQSWLIKKGALSGIVHSMPFFFKKKPNFPSNYILHMQKFYTTFIVLSFLITSSVNAQLCGPCTIDYGYLVPGVYPDTLPPATAGEYYESDITFVMQEDTTIDIVGTLEFLNYHILEPVGAPYGMHVSTNLGDLPVDYDPDVSLYGCARVCGTPLVPGWYEVTVPLIATLEYPGGDQAAEYSIFIEVLPAAVGGGGIIPSATYGCDPLEVDFETSIHSMGADGFSYTWDFGNGSTSTDEFPATQTYTAIGGVETQYIVSHTISIDTIGYQLDYVAVLSSGCDDCTFFGCTGLIEAEKPDLYILIDDLGLTTWPGFEDTSPPVTFSLGIELDPDHTYTMQMKDYDTGAAGGDDNCGTFTFDGDDVGVNVLTTGSHQVEVSISHPVISYTFYDTITVYPAVPTPEITLTGVTVFCEGDSAILDATIVADADYQWFKDGDEIPGADSSSYIVFETGVYDLTVTGTGGCYASSAETGIEVFENPSAPAIIVIGNVLTTSSTWDLQWYYNGSPIPGATDVSYTPAVEGIYQVAAINGPCIAWSVEIDFIFQSIENYAVNNLEVFPNPNTGQFTCSFSSEKIQDLEFIITNIMGEEIISYKIAGVSGNMQQEITLPGNEPGIYFLTIQGSAGKTIIKVVVQ